MSAEAIEADRQRALGERVVELEREVDILQQRLDAFTDAFDRMEQAVAGDVPPGDIDGDLLTRLGTVENRLVDIEQGNGPKSDGGRDLTPAEKVVRYAFDKGGGDRGTTLGYDEVQAVAGFGSPNTAYKLMAEIGATCAFATYTTSPKQLRVDRSAWSLDDALDHLHEATDAAGGETR